MSDADWSGLKAMLRENLPQSTIDNDLDTLERLFRKGEAIGGQAGGTVFRLVQALIGNPALLAEVRQLQERMRGRVRFILREMSDDHWAVFKVSLERALTQSSKIDDLGVLELVFRIGESVSNIEIAALARSAELTGRKPLPPEVARANAIAKAAVPGVPGIDPEAVYLAAKKELEKAEETAKRAEQTLAYRSVVASNSYKHARHTVFQMIDFIVTEPALMVHATRIEEELLALPQVSREEMRWALHRLPLPERLQVIKLIPLNTILMFLPKDGPQAGTETVEFRASRDRRLAYDLFVQGRSEVALAGTYGLTVNAVKNAVGVILQTLLGRPLARKAIKAYLVRARNIEPMSAEEARRRMKLLTSEQRAALLNRIPNCVWKASDGVAPLHKRLFLDYLSGEWVLRVLVRDYNLDPSKRLIGTFQSAGTLTVRGANAAITATYHKVSEEPEVRQCLREWTSMPARPEPRGGEPVVEPKETMMEELLPTAAKPDNVGVQTYSTNRRTRDSRPSVSELSWPQVGRDRRIPDHVTSHS